jgi:hypothetical protein
MNVFVAGVSSETQYVKAQDSYHELIGREGDDRAHIFGSPGWSARIDLCDEFLRRKEFDALLMVDMDMIIPADGLEKLRAWDRDIVSGHYFARDTSPIRSVCTIEKDGKEWPMMEIPKEGLHKIINTGMGFVLIKREVIENVAKLRNIYHPFAPGPIPELFPDGRMVGQDVRFYFYARILGYQLWLDASVRCLHGCTIWLSETLYDIVRPHQEYEWQVKMEEVRKLHGEQEKAQAANRRTRRDI